MRMAILVAVALTTIGAAGSASAFIGDGTRQMYDVDFEADGRGSAGIFFSMPVATDGSGSLEIVDNGVGKTMKTHEALEITGYFGGSEVNGFVNLDAQNLQWNGDSWTVDISLADGSVTGLKELELDGKMTEVTEGVFDVNLRGYAIYNFQRVDLSLTGKLALGEFDGATAL